LLRTHLFALPEQAFRLGAKPECRRIAVELTSGVEERARLRRAPLPDQESGEGETRFGRLVLERGRDERQGLLE
jgi:hypothetical protein